MHQAGVPECALADIAGQITNLVLDSFRSSTNNEFYSLWLDGDLGSGKTTFMRYFATCLGVSEAVTSPTYTIVNRFVAPECVLVHCDLYRLHSALEVEELQLFTSEESRPLFVAIEWATRWRAALPTADLCVEITDANTRYARDVHITSPSGRFIL